MTINELGAQGLGWGPAHTKNLLLISDAKRLALASTYDLVSRLAFIDAHVADNLAMAVGDKFDPRSIRAYEWAVMAQECKIASKLVVDVREKLWLKARISFNDWRSENSSFLTSKNFTHAAGHFCGSTIFGF